MGTFGDRQKWLMFAAGCGLALAVTLFHYLTSHDAIGYHNVYRRLYYIPILLWAFAFGRKGGVLGALVVSLAYIPHAFFAHHQHHHDPAPTSDKALEMLMYFVVGTLSGWMVDRHTRAQGALTRALEAQSSLERQLVRAGKLSALGQLTSGLAHEIRNPLASIMGAAESVTKEIGPGHRKERMAGLLLSEINRLDRLVSDFLRFARPSEPNLEDRVNLRQVCQEVIELTKPQAEKGGVSLGLEVSTEANVRGDRVQLAQVVLNLVLNAIQVLDGRKDATVTLRFEERQLAGEPYHVLIVEDNGPGLEPGAEERIFDPFFTTRTEGTGLGLSVSSRIVEEHGGFIEVEDVQPGARFLVWLKVTHG